MYQPEFIARRAASRTSSFTKTFDNGTFLISLIRQAQSIFRSGPIPKRLRQPGPLPFHRCHPPSADGGFQSHPKTPPIRRATVLPAETPADGLRLPLL